MPFGSSSSPIVERISFLRVSLNCPTWVGSMKPLISHWLLPHPGMDATASMQVSTHGHCPRFPRVVFIIAATLLSGFPSRIASPDGCRFAPRLVPSCRVLSTRILPDYRISRADNHVDSHPRRHRQNPLNLGGIRTCDR